MTPTKREEPLRKMQSSTGAKARQLAALEELRSLLTLVVRLQKNYVEITSVSDDPASAHRDRLEIYDRSVPLLIASYEKLSKELSAKHPGGAPRNKYRRMALDLLIDHYCVTGKVLTTKQLLKRVDEKVPQSELRLTNKNKDPFSSRVAQAVISDFRADLRGTPKT
jgi:hypothetical protein